MKTNDWIKEMFRMCEYIPPFPIVVKYETPWLVGYPWLIHHEPANENLHPIVRFNAFISEPGALL